VDYGPSTVDIFEPSSVNCELIFMEHIKRPYLTEQSIEVLDHLFSAVPPEELRNSLIELYHGYLKKTNGNVAGDLETIANSMYHLIHCLTDVKRE
jgi:hypothetical protein